MGRESRQARRARLRREQERPGRKGINWPIIVGLGVVALALILFGSQALGRGSSHKQVADKPIDGIPCGQEVVTYHQHAHLTILDKGKPLVVPQGVGFGSTNCLYWLHTHDGTGTIHIEGPNSAFHPTLAKFFAIWGEPLSRTRASFATVKPGESMKVYVDQKLYSGNPRTIPLKRHTTITIEVGPPFKAPQKYNFGQQ